MFVLTFSDGSNIVLDETIGSVLRTKQSNVTEGGVASGYAALDSIVLI